MKGGRRIATIVVGDVEIARVRPFVGIVPAVKAREATNGVLARPKEIVRVEDRPGVVVRSVEANAGLIVIASPVPNPSRCPQWKRRFARTTPRSKF